MDIYYVIIDLGSTTFMMFILQKQLEQVDIWEL